MVYNVQQFSCFSSLTLRLHYKQFWRLIGDQVFKSMTKSVVAMPHLKLKPPSQQSVSFNDISPFSSTVNLQPIAGSSHVSSFREIPEDDSVITLSSDEEGRTFYYSSLMFA